MHDRIGRAGVTGPEDFKPRRWPRSTGCKLPKVVRSIFRDPNLRYITA